MELPTRDDYTAFIERLVTRSLEDAPGGATH